MSRDVIVCGVKIGTTESWDGWNCMDLFPRFTPSAEMSGILPACDVLAIDILGGSWTAYDARKEIFAQGRISVQFVAVDNSEESE